MDKLYSLWKEEDLKSFYKSIYNVRLDGEKSSKKRRVFSKDPKKRFPMFIDHIHFLTKRAGWKVTKVHAHYTFEQEPFKKEYVLGNQRARQEAVEALE